MGRGIIGAEISLDFNDASGEEFAALSADKNIAQQIRSNQARVAVVERARENVQFEAVHWIS